MSLYQYPVYYRKYGIFRLSQLRTPPVTDILKFTLPQGAIYHYVSYTGIEIGPAPNDIGFNLQTRVVLMENIRNPVEFRGAPKLQQFNENAFIHDQMVQNRRIRLVRNLDAALNDQQTLLTLNYAMIPKKYRYIRNIFTEYNKWYNLFATMVTQMATIANASQRPQFYILGIPPLIPSLSILNSASEEMTQSNLKYIKESNGFTLLEIWKWLGENRSQSLLAPITPDKAHLINFVYIENGKWTVLNLGALNSFREPTEREKNIDTFYKYKEATDPISAQKKFLLFILRMMELRTLTANIDENAAVSSGLDEEKAVSTNDEASDAADDSSLSKKVEVGPQTVIQDDPNIEIDIGADDSIVETEEQARVRLQQEEDEINQELAKLNEISAKHDAQGTTAHASITDILTVSNADLSLGVMQVCDSLASEGMLSAKEYQRFEKLAHGLESLPNPYTGDEPISAFSKVDPTKLKLTKTENLVKTVGVLDDSMTGSVLHDFNAKYVSEIMPRHVTSMVASIQNAGIAVTGHDVEKVEDILGAYEIHTVKLVPVVGAPTTVRFRIPSINEDGSFVTNNVKYKLKKLRGD